MDDYSFGPSARGWQVIFALCTVGAVAVVAEIVKLMIYLCHHLHWVR